MVRVIKYCYCCIFLFKKAPRLELYDKKNVTLWLKKTPSTNVTHLIQNLQQIFHCFILLGPRPHELLSWTPPCSRMHVCAPYIQETGKDAGSCRESDKDMNSYKSLFLHPLMRLQTNYRNQMCLYCIKQINTTVRFCTFFGPFLTMTICTQNVSDNGV